MPTEIQCVQSPSVEEKLGTLHSPSTLVNSSSQIASPQAIPRQISTHTRSTQEDPQSVVSFSQTMSLKRKDVPGNTHRVRSEDEVAIMDSGWIHNSFPSGKRRRVLASSQSVPPEHEPLVLYSPRRGRRVVAPVPPAPASYGKFHLWLQDVLAIKHVLSCTPGICSICLSHSYHQSMYEHMMDSHITPAMEAILNHRSTPEQLFLLIHYTIIVDITTLARREVVKECTEFSSAHRDRHPSTVATDCLDTSAYPKLRELAMFLSKARLRPQDWVPKTRWVCGCSSRFHTLEELKLHIEEGKLLDASNHQADVSSDPSLVPT